MSMADLPPLARPVPFETRSRPFEPSAVVLNLIVPDPPLPGTIVRSPVDTAHRCMGGFSGRLCGALALAAALLAPAHAAERTLTVYTYESFVAEWGPGPAIKEAFESECGDCEIDFVPLDSSAGILNRVQLEGASTRADVVLGLDTNLMAIAEDSGLLAPSEVDTDALSLPVEWDSDTFVPYDYGFFAFVYDSEVMETPPGSFEELLNAPDETSA